MGICYMSQGTQARLCINLGIAGVGGRWLARDKNPRPGPSQTCSFVPESVLRRHTSAWWASTLRVGQSEARCVAQWVPCSIFFPRLTFCSLLQMNLSSLPHPTMTVCLVTAKTMKGIYSWQLSPGNPTCVPAACAWIQGLNSRLLQLLNARHYFTAEPPGKPSIPGQ